MNIFVRRKRKEFHYADNEFFLTDDYLDLNNKYFKHVPIGYAENFVSDFIDFDKLDAVNQINNNLEGKLITLYDVNRTLTSIYDKIKEVNYNIKDKYILLNKDGNTLNYDIHYEPKSFFKPRGEELNLYVDNLNHQLYTNNIQQNSLTIQNTLHSNTIDSYSMRIHNMNNVISNDDIVKYITVHSTHEYSKRQIITFGKKKRKKWVQLNSTGVTIFSDIEGKDKKEYVVGKHFHPNDICWNGTIFVIVGTNLEEDGACVYWSNDGETWTPCKTDKAYNEIEFLEYNFVKYTGNSVCWNGTFFITVGQERNVRRNYQYERHSFIFYSSNGKEWSNPDNTRSFIARTLCWNGEKLIVYGQPETSHFDFIRSGTHIYSSDTTKNWTSNTIEVNYNTLSLQNKRYGFGVINVDGIISILGGYDDTGEVKRRDHYSPKTNKIVDISVYQVDRHFISYRDKCVTINNILYTIRSNTNYIQIYRENIFVSNYSVFNTTMYYNFGVVVLDKSIYIIGGIFKKTLSAVPFRTELTPHNIVVKFDTEYTEWSDVTDLPNGIAEPAVATLNGEIYVVGGRHYVLNTSSYISNKVFKYSTVSGIWIPFSYMIKARTLHNVAVLDGTLYAIGGYSNEKQVISSVEKQINENGSWHWINTAPMLEKRMEFGVTVIDEKLFVMGGRDENLQVLSSIEWYHPVPDKWYSHIETIQRSVSWNGNNFIMVGDKYTLISNDGTKWDVLTDEYNFTDIVWNGNIHVAIGNRVYASSIILKDEDEEFIIWWSYDGKHWNECKWNIISPVFSLDRFTEKKVTSVEWNGEIFVGELLFKIKYDTYSYNNVSIDKIYGKSIIHSINGKDWTIQYKPILLDKATNNQHILVNKETIFMNSLDMVSDGTKAETNTIYFYCHEIIGIIFNTYAFNNNDTLTIEDSDDGITYGNPSTVHFLDQTTNKFPNEKSSNIQTGYTLKSFVKFKFTTTSTSTSSFKWEFILIPESMIEYTTLKPVMLNDSTRNTKILVDRPINFYDSGGIKEDYNIKKDYTITFYNTHNLRITVNSFQFEKPSAYHYKLYDYLTIQDSDDGESYQNIDNNSWLRKTNTETNYQDMYGMYFPYTTSDAETLSNNTVSFPHTFITRRYVKFDFKSDSAFNEAGWDIVISPLHYTTSFISNSLYENQIIFDPSKMMIVGKYLEQPHSFISHQTIYNWNKYTLQINPSDICWNGYRFVVVGQNINQYSGTNSIQYSDDGYNWLSPEINNSFNGKSICWNGQLFVVVGENTVQNEPRIYYSYNGNIWKAVNFRGTDYFGNAIHVLWNGEKFLTTIHKDTDVYSVGESFDGINWNYYKNTKIPLIRKLCWDGIKYVSISVVINNTVIHHSYDGITWNTGPLHTITNFKGNSICWNGEIFVVVGEDINKTNTENYPIYYSEDGNTWSKATNIQNFLFVGNDICWNGQYFVAVGELRYTTVTGNLPDQLHLIYWSHNGKDWNVDYTSSDMNADFTSNQTTCSLNAICWTGNTVNVSSQGEFNGKVKLNQTSQLSIQSNTDLEFVTDSYDNNTDKSNQIIIDVHY